MAPRSLDIAFTRLQRPCSQPLNIRRLHTLLPGFLPSRFGAEIFHFFFFRVVRAQEGPGWRPDGPRWAQGCARWPIMAPRWAEDGAKTAQDGQKMGQDGAKMRQDGPRRPQKAPRWPNIAPSCPNMVFRSYDFSSKNGVLLWVFVYFCTYTLR